MCSDFSLLRVPAHTFGMVQVCHHVRGDVGWNIGSLTCIGNDRIQCVSKVPQLPARVANSTIHYKSSVIPRFDAMQVLIFRRQSRGAFL